MVFSRVLSNAGSLPHFLTLSRPHSRPLPRSLPHSLTPSLPSLPSLPHDLTISRPHSRPLPRSLTHSLPHSPHSPHSLTHSLARSLTHSLTHFYAWAACGQKLGHRISSDRSVFARAWSLYHDFQQTEKLNCRYPITYFTPHKCVPRRPRLGLRGLLTAISAS